MEIVLSCFWLVLWFFGVQGCPEKEKDREPKMMFAYIFFGIVPIIFYWVNIRK